jgi:glycosyltransferase involved in cell wall biosynthesis
VGRDRELLTVILPCKNEESAIEATVARTLDLAPELPLDLELLLVDDGSTDRTREIMAEICAREPSCRMRVNQRNLGLGRSVLNAYGDIEPGSWVSVLPGDGDVDPATLLGFVELRERCDVILGYVQNPVIRTLRRRAASWVFHAIVRLLYGFDFRYLNGPKLYRLEALAGLPIVSNGYAFNAELLAKAILRQPTLRIEEAPFVLRGRALGASKATRPRALIGALVDVVSGYRAVSAFRARVISGTKAP